MKKMNKWYGWIRSREHPVLAVVAVSIMIGSVLSSIFSTLIGIYPYNSGIYLIIGLLMIIAFGKKKEEK